MRRYILHQIEDISPCIEDVLTMFLQVEKARSRQKDVRLCLHELLANALIHGNQNDTSKKVELYVSPSAEGCEYMIRDEGKGGAESCHCFDATKDLSLNLLENGRGLYLVHAIADYFCYNENDNEWIIKIKW